MNLVMSALVALSILLVPATAQAKFALEELEDVPIERLITNTQHQVEAHPDEAQWRYALARLYSMAYALGDASAKATDDHFETVITIASSPSGQRSRQAEPKNY